MGVHPGEERSGQLAAAPPPDEVAVPGAVAPAEPPSASATGTPTAPPAAAAPSGWADPSEPVWVPLPVIVSVPEAEPAVADPMEPSPGAVPRRRRSRSRRPRAAATSPEDAAERVLPGAAPAVPAPAEPPAAALAPAPSPSDEAAAPAAAARRHRSRGRSHKAPASEPQAMEPLPGVPPAREAAIAEGQADDAPPSEMSAFESFRQPELTAAEQRRLDDLAARLSITFRRPSLLREAMTHASWHNERGAPAEPGHDNERLEYLGDAVLELVAGENLFKRFPGHDEGQLTQLRAALVNTLSLAKLAERLGLGDTLLLGKGAAKTGARQLPSLLANSFEAMIGAIFLDQGYRVATRVFLQSIGDLDEWSDENHKGKLQELAQERFNSTPGYRVAAVGGPGHRREYRAEAVVGGRVVGEGRGGTKQAAEQAAASQALERLGVSAPAVPVPAHAAARARPAPPHAPAAESVRVRRRVAEVAADRSASPGRSAAAAAPAAPGKPRRGLLGMLRVITGRRPEPEPAPEPEPEPEVRKHTRRGHRGGRGRHRPSPSSTPPT